MESLAYMFCTKCGHRHYQINGVYRKHRSHLVAGDGPSRSVKSAFGSIIDKKLNPLVNVDECPKCHRKRGQKHLAITKKPSIATMEKWMDDGVARATDGCRVEPDGTCPHGHTSWIRLMGFINPLTKVHPLAVEAKQKYLEDVKAGHGKGEEYWAGYAGAAYLMSNPKDLGNSLSKRKYTSRKSILPLVILAGLAIWLWRKHEN